MKTRYWVLRQNARTYTSMSVTRFGGDEPDAEAQVQFFAEDIVMEVVLDSDAVFEPPPWVRHGIETRGWRIVSREITESGLVYHGTVDWKALADTLAGALAALQQQEDMEDRQPAEDASKALDDYRIALTEVELARPAIDGGDS